MKKFLFVVLLVLLIAGPLRSNTPYLQLTVWHSDGSWVNADCWWDHSQDTLWTAESDYLYQPQIALDQSATKYSSLGLINGFWVAYTWAGNRMVVGTAYDLLITANWPSHIKATKPDGTLLFDETLGSGETFNWTFYAIPGTTAQWRTKGNKLEVTPVPEPVSVLMLGAGIIGIAGLYRKRK